MRIFTNIFYLLGTLIFLMSCEVNVPPAPEEAVPVTLQHVAEYVHHFNICGDEEGATIISQPQHAEISEIIRNESTSWCVAYRYKPEEGFVGKDFVEIETCTGGQGESCNEKEIIKIVFTVVADCSSQLNVEELKSTWELEKFIDKESGESERLPKGYSASLTFQENGCMRIIAPCNEGQGDYEVSGNYTNVSGLIVTERGCEILDTEEAFTRNLSGTYCISGGQLTIISDSDKDLIFKKADQNLNYNCWE